MGKYFIDCGAHCGESILMAKQRFGEDTVVISFEPVPGLAKQLQEIHRDNPTVSVQNSAVWISNEVKRFHLSEQYTDGSSILTSLNGLREDHYVDIPCFDLSSWIKETFEKEEDYLILKLDIEGAEYEVLNKMIEDGTIDMIDEFWGEWHHTKIQDPKTLSLSNKVYDYLRDNNIRFNEWEIHIPTYGKSHEYLAFRPNKLTDLDNSFR